jgi:hypothetical protein
VGCTTAGISVQARVAPAVVDYKLLIKTAVLECNPSRAQNARIVQKGSTVPLLTVASAAPAPKENQLTGRVQSIAQSVYLV